LEKLEAENFLAKQNVPDEPDAYNRPVNMQVAWKRGRQEKIRI
jgi:hypothetical protein